MGASTARSTPSKYGLGVTCPTSPPSASSPPANLTSTFYDADGRVVQVTSPLGGTSSAPTTVRASSTARSTAANYANGKTLPERRAHHTPTVGSRLPISVRPIDNHDASGHTTQVTNPSERYQARQLRRCEQPHPDHGRVE